MNDFLILLVATYGKPLPDLTYRADIADWALANHSIECFTSNTNGIEPVDLNIDQIVRRKVTGRLLGGRGYSHTKYRYKAHQFTFIGNVTFNPILKSLDDWRDADYHYISIQENGGTWRDFVQVMDETEEGFWSLLDGVTDFKEYDFNLVEVLPL